MSALRRSSGVSPPNSSLSGLTFVDAAVFLVHERGSAPPKTSCQRRPSVVTSRMFAGPVVFANDTVPVVRRLGPQPVGTNSKKGNQDECWLFMRGIS